MKITAGATNAPLPKYFSVLKVTVKAPTDRYAYEVRPVTLDTLTKQRRLEQTEKGKAWCARPIMFAVHGSSLEFHPGTDQDADLRVRYLPPAEEI